MLSTSSPQNDFHLLESLLLEEGTYFLLEEHLARLRASATYFHFPYEEEQIREKLKNQAERQATGQRKVRLLLSYPQGLSVESEKIIAMADGVQLVRVARNAIDERDIFHYHKTTNRKIYDRHLEEGGDTYFDTLLWNSKGEITECTIGNVVFEKDGVKYTPPLSSGVLAGTFRGYLLKKGIIKEKKILLDDLSTYEKSWFINSVRRWLPIKVNEIL